MYKLRDWINTNYLTHTLSKNVRAIEYLENHDDLIDNHMIFKNIEAIHIIEKRIDRDEEYYINYNKNAVNFLRNNRQYIQYNILCMCEHGIEFVDELIRHNMLDNIFWVYLSQNPAAIHILNDPKYYDYIDWRTIIMNPNAAEIVNNNLDKVEAYWNNISEAPHLIHIIENNIDKVFWVNLSKNYNAIHILEKNIDKVDIRNLCKNKNGFTLLLKMGYQFNTTYQHNIHIIFDYFDYCEENNIEFDFVYALSKYGYSEKHFEYLKNNNVYSYLSENPNIFVYDYKRMRKTRQSLPWYNTIKQV
jgi:hypothetical protein